MSASPDKTFKKCGFCGQFVPAEDLKTLLDRQACQPCRRAVELTQEPAFNEENLDNKQLLRQILAHQRGNAWLLRGILLMLLLIFIPFSGETDFSPKAKIALAVAFVCAMLSLIPARKAKEELTQSVAASDKPKTDQTAP